MEINHKTRNQLRLQGYTFVILFLTMIGLLAWISHKYNFEADWTANNRNTLSEISTRLLQQIPGNIKITAFVSDSNMLSNREYIAELVKRYQKIKDDITLEFINPDTAPDISRAMGITNYGEVLVEYKGRKENISNLTEQQLTNVLQRLLRQGERKLLFLSGHGERNPSGKANFDWQLFNDKLKTKGILTQQLLLNETPEIPPASALVIASPQTTFLPGEVKLIIEYVNAGGNLLWLHEPATAMNGLQPLADALGISFVPGTIVDPTTQLLQQVEPTFALITSYPAHEITKDFKYMSIFPRAVGVKHDSTNTDFQAVPLLNTVARSWSETGELKGVIDYNAGKDIAGPLTIAMALTRNINKQSRKINQRIIVLGDGDFLSNTYLGNQGNLSIGMNMMNWLTNDDEFITIPASSSVDTQLNISETAGAVFGLFYLIVLPLLLLTAGVSIWLKRRKR